MREGILKKYWYNVLLFLIILLGCGLRLKGLSSNILLWHDEYTLSWRGIFNSHADFLGIFHFMRIHPPFFMIATKFITNIIGLSDLNLKLIPFLFGCAAIPAFYLLAGKVLKVQSTIFWATFLFAVNMPLINYSFQFKPYSLDVFFVVILLLFFINFNIERLSIIKTITCGILVALIPWFSFTSLFIIVGGGINIFFRILKNKNSKCFLPFIFFLFPILISGLIYLKMYLINNYTGMQLGDYYRNSFLTLNSLSFLGSLTESIKYFFFSFSSINWTLFSLIMIVWGGIVFYLEKSEFLNISVFSFILLYVASLLHIYPYFQEFVLFLIPIFLLLMMKPLDMASFRNKFQLLLILVLLFFIVVPQIVVTDRFIKLKNFNGSGHPNSLTKIITKKLN